MAVLGRERNLEEDRAKLIERELGMKVKPEKDEIKKVLRRRGIKESELLKKLVSRP